MTQWPDQWTDLDDRAVVTARALAADAVENVGNGHPGTAMALAPAAYLLFQRFLRHDPNDPTWLGRDRFILSCGHTSLTLYIQLYLSGYPITLEDLKHFRTLGSLTPGHPEHNPARGIEMTTGPLGQGISSAVGIAMAQRYTRGLLDPDADPGASPFDSTVWVLASDGDLQEGISAEASSLAGSQALGNLVVVWDDNRISIEGDTALAFTEDVAARYRGYGWHTQRVDLAPDGSVDVAGLAAALDERASTHGRAIADPAALDHRAGRRPTPQTRARRTGPPWGRRGRGDQGALGLDPDRHFDVDEKVLDHAREVMERGAALHAEWEVGLPGLAGRPTRARSAARPPGQPASCPTAGPTPCPPSSPAARWPRARRPPRRSTHWPRSCPSCGAVPRTSASPTAPRSAAGASSSRPIRSALGAHPYGRTVHFGVREHAMGAILNGVGLHGLTRAYGGTFLIFSDYMRPSVRLAALMSLPSIFVWTHDSIGLGEDGPTHQPVEHLWALRAIPGLSVVRPADATETVEAWAAILTGSGPAGLVLTRQDVPVLARPDDFEPGQVQRGGYVFAEAGNGSPE